MAELCTAIVSVAIGTAAFRQLTFGVMSLCPALAHEAAQRHAIESFPLGSWLGGLWYGVFPATPSLLATIGAMAGLALAFSVLSAFAGGREHLDYSAMHRMTNDRHVRLYADGDEEDLPAMQEGYVVPQGATVAEQEAARDKYYSSNQAVEKLLEEKGFVMTDQAHGSARVNRYLQTHPDAGGLLR